MDDHGLTRRETLLRLGGLAAGALGAGAFLGDDADAGPRAVAAGLVACVLSPELTPGPFALDGDRLRRDIREGKAGVPLTLRTTVIDVSTCKPVAGAAVDIWHCDAGGSYSGFAQEGTAGRTFLRGVQKTDRNGVAVFKTIYPGWYPGRAVHVHVRVYVGGNIVHTGQLFFPEAVTDAVYRRSPYRRRPSRDTRNAADSIFRNGGRRSLLKLTRTAAGAYTAGIALGIHR
jgi:protocatechuate 3,4-dioxygenase beta subunit